MFKILAIVNIFHIFRHWENYIEYGLGAHGFVEHLWLWQVWQELIAPREKQIELRGCA